MKARRTRGSLNLSRRMLKTNPCITPTLRIGNSSSSDALVLHRREIIGASPSPWRCSRCASRRWSPLNASSATVSSRKYSIPHLVEIVAPDIDVEILAPIVLDALVDDGAAGDELLDAIGAVAERRLERGGADVALVAGRVGAFPPVLRQHVELADDLRQFAVAGPIEGEGHLALAGLLRLHDVAIIGGELRIVLLERYRTRRSRPRASPACRRASAPRGAADRSPRKNRADGYGFGQQSVFGRRPRRATAPAACRRGSSTPLASEPLHAADHQVEIVERARRADPRTTPPFGAFGLT